MRKTPRVLDAAFLCHALPACGLFGRSGNYPAASDLGPSAIGETNAAIYSVCVRIATEGGFGTKTFHGPRENK